MRVCMQQQSRAPRTSPHFSHRLLIPVNSPLFPLISKMKHVNLSDDEDINGLLLHLPSFSASPALAPYKHASLSFFCVVTSDCCIHTDPSTCLVLEVLSTFIDLRFSTLGNWFRVSLASLYFPVSVTLQ